MEFVQILILVLIITALSITALSIILNFSKKKATQKMYLEIENILNSLIKEDKKEEYVIIKNDNNAYDYEFHTPNCLYYIKIIPNAANQEICVNNSVKWQLRRSFNDESLRFVENVEGLMRMDISVKSRAKKIYIIYPNARSLLKYINECEMVFIHPTTDVYGTNIIPYMALKDNPELLTQIGEI